MALHEIISNMSPSEDEEIGILKYLGDKIPSNSMDVAISHGRIDIIKYLLSIGFHVTKSHIKYVSCFDLEILKLFISNGYSGNIMLSYAMKRGNPEIIKYLLKEGYNPTYSDIYEACVNLKQKVIEETCGVEFYDFESNVNYAMEKNNLDELVKKIMNA